MYMKTYKRTVYWASTIFLAIGMLAGGIQQALQIGGYVPIARDLGYPVYLLSIIGIWKILGVVALLLPGTPVLKEWAYAGFIFVMSGAAVSHFLAGQPYTEAIPSLILLAVALVSWHFRPADRRVPTSLNPSL